MATKKAPKKKAVKKVTKKVVAKKTVHKPKPRMSNAKAVDNAMRALAIVPAESLLVPEMEQGKYTLVKTQIKTVQIEEIMRPTPAHLIKTRPAKGGGTWQYIEGWTAKQYLNHIFGFLWSGTVVEKWREGDFIMVLYRLTILNPKTLQPLTVKEQVGSAEVKYKTEQINGKKTKTEQPLDLGNDYKSAITDGLKKCCAEMGMFWDVYGHNEPMENNYQGTPPSNGSAPAKPVASTPEELQQVIINAIEKANDTSVLMQIDAGVQGSDKLNKNIKQALHQAINNKIDLLSTPQ